jgi:hypothetical protein
MNRDLAGGHRWRAGASSLFLYALGVVLILFPVVVLLAARPFISLELDLIVRFCSLFGGEFTRTAYDTVQVVTPGGGFPIRITLFNSSLVFLVQLVCLFLLTPCFSRRVRLLAVVVSGPVIFFGNLSKILVFYAIDQTTVDPILRTLEFTAGTLAGFFFLILGYICCALILIRNGKLPIFDRGPGGS